MPITRQAIYTGATITITTAKKSKTHWNPPPCPSTPHHNHQHPNGKNHHLLIPYHPDQQSTTPPLRETHSNAEIDYVP